MEALRGAGMQPISLPLLELAALPPPATDMLHRQATEAHQVIAISPSAVTFGRDWWPQPWPPTCAVAAVGAGTGRAWRDAGAAHVIEPEGSGDSEALLAHAALQDVAGQRIVILRGEGGRDLLGPTLRARGAAVVEWLCYTRRPPAHLREDLTALLDAPPDAWVLTSSEALANLEAAWPEGAERTAPVFAAHPRIVEAARQAGWMTIISDGGDAGLMRALRTWFDANDHE